MPGEVADPRIISLRAHYWIRRHESEPGICVREPRTDHGAAMLPLHYAGWQLTHDLLGACAPRSSRFDGRRIDNELVAGVPLHHWYAAQLAGTAELTRRLPWPVLWTALSSLWSSGRPGPQNPALTVTTLWATWFSIPRLADAKRHTLIGWRRHPGWSARAAASLALGKLRGGYSSPPAIASEIFARSKTGLIVGDMHFANLVGNPDRIAFVDFSEVATAPVALDLAPLWFEWWLFRGLLDGDDGFLQGFRMLWRAWVGAERLLVQMTREWADRAFPWLYYSAFADHLELDPELAERLASRARAAVVGRRRALASSGSLEGLIQ